MRAFKAKQRHAPMTSLSEIQIRVAGEDDLAVLNRLALAHGYKETDYFMRCLDESRAGRRRIILALDNASEGLGYVMLNRQPLYQPFRSAGIPEVQDLFILPEWRRQGLGETLVKACEEAARTEGCDMIGLAVGLHSGYGAAQRLYVQMGYVPDGFGVVYESQNIKPGEMRRVDDDLCLMMVKDL
jgi:GNAT superfamily N-acetyltransferase